DNIKHFAFYLQSSVFSPSPTLSSCPPRLCPLSFGEGVEFDPLPAKEIRYTSSVRYGSERRFIADVLLRPALAVSRCSQTILCVPDCSWRRYRAELRLQPRHAPQRFTSTTIIYPKHAKTVYTTTLGYDCRKTARRFLASVELESSECPGDGC
ncbi:hypothetical protein Nmel_016732, partial [Mimus melanotis]